MNLHTEAKISANSTIISATQEKGFKAIHLTKSNGNIFHALSFFNQ